MARDDEVGRLRERGLDVFESNGRVSFGLPCPRLGADLACEVYADRPDACARYRCGMLDEYLDGVIDLEQSAARLAEVERLLANVRAVTDSAMTIAGVRQRWRRGLADYLSGDPATAAEEQAAFLHITALCRYLDRYILSPLEQSIMRDLDHSLEPTPDPS